MFIGTFFVIAACFCWGLIFIVPKFLPEFNAIEIALGRFFFFGLVSMILLLCKKRYLINQEYKNIWVKALLFGFISTMFCYTCLVYCMRFTSPSVAALIYGMAPVTITLFGNLQKNEYPYRLLIFPLLLISTGIIFVNINAFSLHNITFKWYFLGLLIGFAGLASWTWYTIANSHFIKDHAMISMFDWIIIMGVATFFITSILGIIWIWQTPISPVYPIFFNDIKHFLIGSIILGVISSWVSFYFWNLGNRRLPISLAGQLTIFEMIFGLLFIYLVEKRLPFPLETIGIGLMLAGVLTAFNKLSHNNEK